MDLCCARCYCPYPWDGVEGDWLIVYKDSICDEEIEEWQFTDPFAEREIGKTGMNVTRMGLGARGIVDPNLTVSDSQAKATVETSLGMGVNYIDTSPRYGLGRSEQLVGQSTLPEHRGDCVVSTKVGRILDPRSAEGCGCEISPPKV